MRYKYCDDDVYKADTYQALASQFKDQLHFESFYSSLKDCSTKNEFIRVGSAYLFFVKNGDWHVDIKRSNPIVEYLTNSFKLVALLALIESLSELENVDFFFWLSEESKIRSDLFPIADMQQLRTLYENYKFEYGSIRSCKLFFSNLSTPTKEILCKAISIDGNPAASIEKVVGMIYKVRSAFAHECETTLEISNVLCVSKDNNKEVNWKLPMSLLQRSFEEGVVAHFKRHSQPQRESSTPPW